jgi:hypothetical protein
VKDWEIIADDLSKAGWSWGCVAAVDSVGRTIWIVDAHRDNRKRFVVRADEILTAFLELELAIRACGDCKPAPQTVLFGTRAGRLTFFFAAAGKTVSEISSATSAKQRTAFTEFDRCNRWRWRWKTNAPLSFRPQAGRTQRRDRDKRA